MSSRAPRACRVPGCPHPQPCPVHRPARSPSSRATSTREWRRTRLRILKRDHWTCQHCGARLTRANAEVDHLDAVSVHGPATTDDRLVASCTDCNNRRGNRT